MLEELKATDNPGGRPLSRRLDWAVDLALPVLADKRQCDVLLWLGDGAFDLRTQRSLRALVLLLRRAGIDFAVLGAEELDCGDVARRLGDEATFQDLARRNVSALRRYAFNRIVTADPHALHTLRNEYKPFGFDTPVIHHTAFLLELLQDGKLTVNTPTSGNLVTYHDPCYLGRYNGEIDAPRALLDLIGVERVEMERSGMRSSCCGGGGGAPLTDVAGKRRIPDVRMDHARETGASTVAVACPNCALMLEGVVGPRPQVAEIAELVLAATEAPNDSPQARSQGRNAGLDHINPTPPPHRARHSRPATHRPTSPRPPRRTRRSQRPGRNPPPLRLEWCRTLPNSDP